MIYSLFRKRPASDAEVASPAAMGGCDGASAHPRAMAEIAGCRERVAHRVGELDTLAEQGILASGKVLAGIVENVRELIAETDRTVAESMAQSDAVTSRFIGEMQHDISAQAEAVEQVLALADGMQEAIEAINALSHYSNVLSVNARIEAARIGERGAGFAVIADHTRELSKTIREAAGRVGAAIVAVRKGLPPVSERASAMHERTRTFIDVVGEQMRSASLQAATGSAGSRRLDGVIRLSNEALSHLQFHDHFSHALAAINRDLGVVEDRVGRVLGGEDALEPIAADAVPSAEHPEPGKVTLF